VKGSGPALFLIHSVLGDVVGCRHLTRLLDPAQRVYGIQVPVELRTSEFVSSVEGMATRYVQELLAFEPCGPYILGGWSAGAAIGLEMAQQLRARGHDVPLLIAIDAAPANTGGGTKRTNPLYYWKLLRNIPQWLKQDFLHDFSWRRPLQMLRWAIERAVRRFTTIVKGFLIPKSDTNAIVKHRVATFMGGGQYSESAKAFMSALFLTLQRYVPKRYGGKVLLYMVMNESLLYLREVDRKWKKIADDVDVVGVGGNHVTLMLGSHVKQLAQDLNKRLASYRSGQPPTAGMAEVGSDLATTV
jgi:thioesterase domain-containing protein